MVKSPSGLAGSVLSSRFFSLQRCNAQMKHTLDASETPKIQKASKSRWHHLTFTNNPVQKFSHLTRGNGTSYDFLPPRCCSTQVFALTFWHSTDGSGDKVLKAMLLTFLLLGDKVLLQTSPQMFLHQLHILQLHRSTHGLCRCLKSKEIQGNIRFQVREFPT